MSEHGNNTAMREALMDIAMQCLYVAEGISDESDYGRVTLMRIRDKARAALSAPARNCDRHECAWYAQREFRRVFRDPYGKPPPSGDEILYWQQLLAWLFDTAEGGAE